MVGIHAGTGRCRDMTRESANGMFAVTSCHRQKAWLAAVTGKAWLAAAGKAWLAAVRQGMASNCQARRG